MLSMLPKETYTLEEFQKTLGELAEKIPERTAECTAIKRRFLNLAKATVVWDYLDAKVLQKSHPAIQTFSLKEYQKLIYGRDAAPAARARGPHPHHQPHQSVHGGSLV